MTPPLSPFEWLYFQALRRRRERLGTPRGEGVAVVSVGNLSLGGTGKTPAVRWLARRALAAGIAPAIVSRGYGGSLSAQGAVVSDGRQVLLGAAQAGDEPIEHARSLPGVPVVIGRDRHAAVRRARDLGAQVAILDDGFSFWSLARACDIVLLDARRPLGNGRLLPRGRLREEPAALGRAHAILLTRADSCTPEELERSHEIVRRYSAAPVWRCRHAPVAVVDQSGREQSLQVLAGAPVAAVSALANNALFARSLEKLGAQVRAHSARRDHHAWSEREIARAAEQARRLGALALVTTGKDAAKIPEPWTRGLPLWQLRIEMEIDGGEALWDLVRAALDSAPR